MRPVQRRWKCASVGHDPRISRRWTLLFFIAVFDGAAATAQWATPALPGASSGRTITLPLEAVMPNGEPAAIRPSPFLLERADGRRLGPFVFRNGARVTIGSWVAELQIVEGMSFTLSTGAGARPLGPFPLEDDAVLRIGAEEFRLRRLPALVTGRVRLAASASPRVNVALARWDDELFGRLKAVRVEFQRIAGELSLYAAPRRDDAPIVRDTRGRAVLNPDITRSQADLDRAHANAEQRAKNAVENLLRESRARTTACDADGGEFAFTELPAGRYLVCLIAQVRAPDRGRTPRFEPRYWWADVILDEHDVAEVEFTGEGHTWRTMFP